MSSTSLNDRFRLVDLLIEQLADAVAVRITAKLQSAPTASPPTPEGLLDEPAMAERLGISQQSLQRLRKKEVVPRVRCGRRVLYRPDDVIAALKSQEKGGAV